MAGYTPAAWGASPSPAQGCGPGGAPPCGGHAALQGPAGALLLAPPWGATRFGAIGPPVFSGTPRGDVAAYAPGDVLPGLVGPALASACPHAAAARRPFSHGLIPPSPRGGPPYCRMPGGPDGRHPGASRSPPRSAVARQGRVVALRARSALSMGGRRAPSAEAWAGASAAAAGRAMKGTPTPRRSHRVRGPGPGSREAAKCSSPRTGTQERPHCPPGWGGPARPPTPSRTWAPRRHAGARPLSVRWAPALPLH